MSAVAKRKLTPAEYLAIERAAPFKSEFFNGEMFAMAGATPAHNTVKENLIGEIYGRLKGGPCRSYSSDQRVKVEPSGLYTYPDIVIVCGKPEFDPLDSDTLVNPQIIIEVLSPSTERYDRGAKFRHYQQCPSIQEVVLVAQDRIQVDRFVRQADGNWLLTVFADRAAQFSLTTVPVSFPVADIYARVDMPTESTFQPGPVAEAR
jgi:Uma2 family endonuclease